MAAKRRKTHDDAPSLAWAPGVRATKTLQRCGSDVLHQIYRRELGCFSRRLHQEAISRRRTDSLELSDFREVVSTHSQAVSCIDIDQAEHRFMLSCGFDGKISLYDVRELAWGTMEKDLLAAARERSRAHRRPQRANGDGVALDAESLKFQSKPLFPDSWRAAHSSAANAVAWYPFDTGMFVSCGLDRKVMVWDTNLMDAATVFRMDCPVYDVAMSPLATAHHLIAAATKSPHVRLCDLVSGAFSHTLIGHSADVLCVSWSPRNPFALVSGSLDESIRAWDVRRPGALMVFDKHNYTDTRTNVRFINPQDSARSRLVQSHAGPVTCVRHTPDGLFLLSTGCDQRLHLWDVQSGRNTLLNYPQTRNDQRSCRISVSDDGQVVFYPNGTRVSAFDVHSGRLLRHLSGHFDVVLCSAFHPTRQELYSAGKDGLILSWNPAADNASYRALVSSVRGADSDLGSGRSGAAGAAGASTDWDSE